MELKIGRNYRTHSGKIYKCIYFHRKEGKFILTDNKLDIITWWPDGKLLQSEHSLWDCAGEANDKVDMGETCATCLYWMKDNKYWGVCSAASVQGNDVMQTQRDYGCVSYVDRKQ